MKFGHESGNEKKKSNYCPIDNCICLTIDVTLTALMISIDMT